MLNNTIHVNKHSIGKKKDFSPPIHNLLLVMSAMNNDFGGQSRSSSSSSSSWSDWYVRQLSGPNAGLGPTCASLSVHEELHRLGLGASRSRQEVTSTANATSTARQRRREHEARLAVRDRLAAEVASRQDVTSHGSSVARPLLQDAIDALSTFVWHEDDTTSSRDCTICMREFEVGDVLMRLPCVHNFHRDCIASWLARQGTCPLCRRPPEIAEIRDEARLSHRQ